MKGLIYKDLQTLLAYKNSLILFCLSFLLISFTNNNFQNILPFMLIFLSTMSVMSTFSFDEQAKWNRFALTLPIDKKDLVKSKYYLYLLLGIAGLLIGFLVMIILTLVSNTAFSIAESISILVGTFLGISIFASIQYPIIYKFGLEKARIYLFGLVFLFVGIIGGGAILFENMSFSWPISFTIPTIIIEYGLPIFLLMIAFLILYLSYRISLRIFMKKEF